jgi:uncharacterized integral membrane protein
MSGKWAILASVFLVLVVILAIQNTEVVETHILFATVSLSRAVLIFASAAFGFGAGAVLIKRPK